MFEVYDIQTQNACAVCYVFQDDNTTHSTVEVHHFFAEAPHLTGSTPHLNLTLDKNHSPDQ